MNLQKLFIGTLLTLILALPAFAGQSLGSGQLNQIKALLNRHIAALQRGNVAELKSTLGGKAYQDYKALLEQNTEYPAFLRDYYKGARFEIGEITPGLDDDVVANLVIALPSSTSSVTQLRLSPTGQGWKIVDIVHPGEGRN
jgi:hypothetical protein